ncbi:winged helix-turn-helix transcriptional regulator [Chitinophaga nivalis]|uniref:Winged helix-turn-helix transcriptional regulator n=1 Tax=Chitinophaga nivalis TaxID=2991709 RepID=A0ABT3IH33_9BACT|nr:winged helix-turn-helix transcriptional regulator [Chitinophaga nivalis]MCW3467047.1 winged helix-turn-helix transcriptional regulator [Chitinophaga nivalis]MCW3483262.1 winged helix-turn-helix transcriptional regulator [Chitinophaga nivalis]
MSKIKESSTNFANKQILGTVCAEIYAASLIGGQWTLAICCHLANGKLRFGELKELIPNITERMLTLQLRKMEADKLVTRTVYPTVPLRVEYELTDSGQALRPIIKQLAAWGQEHRNKIRHRNKKGLRYQKQTGLL